MTIDNSIFGLRFGANVKIYPTQDELRAFIESPKRKGHWESHSDDLTLYTKMLEAVLEFERQPHQEAGPRDFRERIFYGVLAHSRFFSAALKAEVEYFKYHAHSLLTLDFKKPAAFIKTAEEETGRLNPKKKEDAVKLAKLRGMIAERENTIEALRKRRKALADELKHIARYIRENLIKIETLCETSIVVLVDPKLATNEKTRIIEDIEAFLQEETGNELHQSPITKRLPEADNNDLEAVSREVSPLIRDDLYAVTRLFEAIYEHAVKIVREIDAVMAELNDKRERDFEESGKLFTQLEQAVVSLVSGFNFTLEATARQAETAHKDFLLVKRREMLDRIFELLLKERRTRQDRRTAAERRKAGASSYKDSERRTAKERRTRKSRKNT